MRMQIHTAGGVRAPVEVLARQEASVDLRDRENVARTVDRAFVWAFIAVLVLMVLVPLYWVFEASLVDGARGIRAVFGGDRWPRVLGTTVALAVGSVSIAVVLGTLLAWFAHRLPPG